jgi:hypothetical protein
VNIVKKVLTWVLIFSLELVTLICYFFHNNSCVQETAVWEEARANRNARRSISNAEGTPAQKGSATGSSQRPAFL